MLRNNIINNIHFGDMPNIYKFSSTSQSRISFTIIKYLFSKIVNLIKSKIFNFAIIWVNNNILFYIIRFYNNNKTNYPKLVYIERYIVFVWNISEKLLYYIQNPSDGTREKFFFIVIFSSYYFDFYITVPIWEDIVVTVQFISLVGLSAIYIKYYIWSNTWLCKNYPWLSDILINICNVVITCCTVLITQAYFKKVIGYIKMLGGQNPNSHPGGYGGGQSGSGGNSSGFGGGSGGGPGGSGGGPNDLGTSVPDYTDNRRKKENPYQPPQGIIGQKKSIPRPPSPCRHPFDSIVQLSPTDPQELAKHENKVCSNGNKLFYNQFDIRKAKVCNNCDIGFCSNNACRCGPMRIKNANGKPLNYNYKN